MTKYLLILLLVCLAAVEYFHHRSEGHAHHALTDAAPQAKGDAAREMLRQHLYGH
jgi:DNA-binding GntR family transcriptional regulator